MTPTALKEVSARDQVLQSANDYVASLSDEQVAAVELMMECLRGNPLYIFECNANMLSTLHAFVARGVFTEMNERNMTLDGEWTKHFRVS
jgi:hypothetical protein